MKCSNSTMDGGELLDLKIERLLRGLGKRSLNVLFGLILDSLKSFTSPYLPS